MQMHLPEQDTEMMDVLMALEAFPEYSLLKGLPSTPVAGRQFPSVHMDLALPSPKKSKPVTKVKKKL
jgi:hypothetical protein